jgi:hypothetical protein
VTCPYWVSVYDVVPMCQSPTSSPTEEPTATPTAAPTDEPTATPTESPTDYPTAAPTEVRQDSLIYIGRHMPDFDLSCFVDPAVPHGDAHARAHGRPHRGTHERKP